MCVSSIAIGTMAAAASFLASACLAETQEVVPPPPGWIGSFGISFIVCDSKDQLREIVLAGESGYSKGVERYKKYFAERNDKGMARCDHYNAEHPVLVRIGISEEIGYYYDRSDIKTKAWAIAINNGVSDRWLLFGVNVDGAKPEKGT